MGEFHLHESILGVLTEYGLMPVGLGPVDIAKGVGLYHTFVPSHARGDVVRWLMEDLERQGMVMNIGQGRIRDGNIINGWVLSEKKYERRR